MQGTDEQDTNEIRITETKLNSELLEITNIKILNTRLKVLQVRNEEQVLAKKNPKTN